MGGDGHVIEPLRQVREDEWFIETKTVTSTDEFGEEISREEIGPQRNIGRLFPDCLVSLVIILLSMIRGKGGKPTGCRLACRYAGTHL